MARKQIIHPTFKQALGQAVQAKQGTMSGCKLASRNKVACRVSRFVIDGYNAHLGWQSSVNDYLNRLSRQGKSKSYIRGVRSTLLNVGHYLPTHQPDLFLFGGAL
ncbi:hypothetical protein QUF64_03630 [Anaerolineales bacterium HSG6]|nr:hypothetical protein [Anaerolineales bacterium HSG6]